MCVYNLESGGDFIMKKSIYLIFVFILLFSISSFALTIEYPKIDILNKQTDASLYFRVYDSSFILQNNSIDCSYSLFNNSGNKILQKSASRSNFDFIINVGKGNFSEFGTYYYSVYCNSTTEGGFTSQYFEVNNSGKKGNDWVMLISILSIMFLMCVFLFMGWYYGKLEGNDVQRTFFGLLNLLSYFVSLFLGLVLVFLLMMYNKSEFMSGVFDSVFYVYGITFGWIAGIGAVILFFVLIILMFMQLFSEKKGGNRESSSSSQG